MKVGFIGLGSMGLPMAQRILSEGHDLTVYARRVASLEPFTGTNATIATTPAEMGRSSEAVGICVFDAAGVEEVMFGPSGLVETLEPGTVVLVHSTVSPAEIQSIADRARSHGLRVLDAPVSGGGTRALSGELTIMVGGEAGTLADVNDLLSSLSNHVVHLGGIGAGSQSKLINNALFTAQIVLADDAMRAGESLGVDLAALADVLMTSSSACLGSASLLRAGSLAAIAGGQTHVTLVKDVKLMAGLLRDAPGNELVEVAWRFVTAVERM